jgi:ubiquinone/menaquinone biosynthesis C-methylase UbiE
LQVIGIDPDLDRLKIAREKYSANNIEFLEGAAEEPPLQRFDIVFSNSVLHWCEDKDKVFKQVAKRLQDGGKFGFVIPVDFDTTEQFFTPANMLSPECREAMMNDVHIVSSKNIKELLKKNDFTIKVYNRIIREWVFEDVNKLIEFHMTHSKGQFDHEHFNVDVMKHHYGDGKINFNMPYITVVAIKK